MTTRTRRTRGQSSVFTAVIMALAVIFIIAAIMVSWPAIKSTFDKNYWSGSMGLYSVKFANSSYAYAQNGASGQVGSSPTPIGYCIALSPSTTYAISACPSTTPSYQSPTSPQQSLSPPSNNYYVYVTVTGDSYGAGWSISSSVTSISGTNNVNNEQLQIGGQTDTLTAQITSNPPGYSCSITPSSESVSAGNSYTFTVSCQPTTTTYYVYVTVTGDSYGAGWEIGSSVDSISGSGNAYNEQLQIGGQTDTLTATITSNPSGYTCTITPTSEQVSAGNSYTFTVNCQPTTYYIYVTVTGDNYGAGWTISSSVTSISGSGDAYNEQLEIGGQTDTVTATITSNPPGYQCSINPSFEWVSAGNSYTFTVSCQQQSQPLSPITVVVNDQYNAGWIITWSGAASGGQGGSSSDTFTVQPTSNGAVTFTASIFINPNGYTCTISPNSATAQPGQTITFTVNCQPNQPATYYVYVTVTGDSYGAGWQISSSVSSISGSGDVNNEQLQIGGQTDTLTASITSNPSGYQCSISPTSVAVQAGQTVQFTVSCQPTAYYVYVTVTGNNYGAGWEISSSVSSISGSSNANNQQLQIGGPTDTLTAQITSNPPGYQCTISPSSELVSAGNSYTFTISCQPVAYYVYVTVTGDNYGAGWEISSSVASISGANNVNNEQLQIGGQADTLFAQITSDPFGYICSISPTSTTVQAGQAITFTVSCWGWWWW